MDETAADCYVYGALALSSSVYALLLDYNKRYARRKWEPDWTWAEVAIGVALCLGAGAARSRLERPRTMGGAERAYLLAFLVGGTPIVIWQLLRMAQRHTQRVTTLQQYATKDTYATPTADQRPPAGLAALRSPRQNAHGRDRKILC